MMNEIESRTEFEKIEMDKNIVMEREALSNEKIGQFLFGSLRIKQDSKRINENGSKWQ